PGRRAAGIVASLAGAALILAAVVVPEAHVVVAPLTEPLPPLTFDLHAGPGGDLTAATLTATLRTTLDGRASGSRTEEHRATGTVQFSNKQTFDIQIPAGTEVRTGTGVRFVTTEAVRLPASAIVTFFDILVGRVDAPVEAVLPGPEGNVAAGRIVVSPQPASYDVTNPEAAAGGEIRTIPIVQASDYAEVEARAAGALEAAAAEQAALWEREAAQGTFVVPRVRSQLTAITSAGEVVGREVEAFSVEVTGIATTYSVQTDDIRAHGLSRLRAATLDRYDVLPSTAVIELGSPVLAEDGVRWTVTARAIQARRTDSDRLRRLLAGRGPADVDGIVDEEGLRLVRIERIPAWWPLLPVLDARISVDVLTPSVATGP
ncbi:MAG TPA: baseplate J/gp47 family protein, partial [Candidatus Limnocylindrales bacterium]|nr:baseplate J/gp47 family protein [Candidatus Limnocylindrales bacterium]